MTFKGLVKDLLFWVLPLKQYMKITYWWYHKRSLDLDNPKSFTEKLFWLKLYYGIYEKELIQECYDKLAVRQYVTSKVGAQYLPQLYRTYDSADEIDFAQLPDKYVLKITQSCGYNIIHNGHNSLNDVIAVKTQLREWLNQTNDLKAVRRMHKEGSYHFNGKSRILCEEYLENVEGEIGEDIRLYCFNGKAKFFSIDFDSMTEDGIKKIEYNRNVYDLDKNFIDVNFGRPNDMKQNLPELKKFSKMIEIAEELADDFIFVRVDFYNLDGRIIVGELTFIPMGGAGKIEPMEYDYKWGQELQLPQVKLF